MVRRQGDILYTREGERFGNCSIVPANVPLCISQRMMASAYTPITTLRTSCGRSTVGMFTLRQRLI